MKAGEHDSGGRVIDITKTVFPVAAATGNGQFELAQPRFFGTAFAIAPGLFLSAYHVTEAAKAAGAPMLLGPTAPGAPLGGKLITQVEAWPDIDVALIHCPVTEGVTLLNKWLAARPQVLQDIASFGYPHAITHGAAGDRLDVVFRAYKGYVIATRQFERLPALPGVFEVSTPFPEGMSGAPALWTSPDGHLFVVGLVLGESVVEYGGVANRVGIALPADQIGDIASPVLGKKIRELVHGFAFTASSSTTTAS